MTHPKTTTSKTWRWLAAALLLLGTAGLAPAGEPLRVGVSLGLTGRFTEMATMQQRGYRLWETTVNARGGLRGRPVSVQIEDDRGDPDATTAIYRRFLKDSAVDLVFGPYSSQQTEAAAAVAEEAHSPMLAAGGSADTLWEQGRRYLVGVFTPAGRYAVGFLEMLVVAGVESVAIVHAEDAFSVAVAQGTRTWAKRFGLDVPLVAAITDDNDLPAALAQARAAGVGGLVICGYYAEAVRTVRSLDVSGWRPRALFATVGPALPGFLETAGPLAEGVFSASQWMHHDRLPLAGSAQFHANFVARFGEPPSYHAATAYASGQVLEAAVAAAGTLDREGLRDALFTLNTTTVIGRFGVDRTGRQIRHFPLITQWQDDRLEVVWPQDLRTAEPRLHRAP